MKERKIRPACEVDHLNAELSEAQESRILFLCQTRKDAELTNKVLLGAGIECFNCATLQEMCAQLDAGAGAVIFPEECVASEGEVLDRWLRDQPPWSDLPVLVLARLGADSEALTQAMHSLGNVTVLERPMRISALVSAVQSALRARQRQYQIREHLERQLQAELELREDDRRKDEFLAILAHELRNPLAPLRNALDLFGASESFNPELGKVRQVMERQVDHMIRLVDDLLEISRITRGKIELRREQVDIGKIMTAAIETSLPQIKMRNHRLDVSLPNGSVNVNGDPVRLAQVFSNLLNNASKYTEPGGVIKFKAQELGNQIEVSVADNGNGISEDMLQAVFEIFRQCDRDKHRSQGGLGIGLTLAKRLVESHGGEIEATSKGLGQGSRFLVRLPRNLGSGAGAPLDAQAAPTKFLDRVLLVDDNRDAVAVLAALLERHGAEVRTAYCGTDALEILRDFHPKSILLDLGMPGMSGHEVAKRIRQIPGSDAIKLIALTGWGQPEERTRSKASGFDYHLVKPVDFNELEKVLCAEHPVVAK